MSFKEQERVLFELLFDSELRKSFCMDADTALADFDLETSELNDFTQIRTDALEFDAKLRADLILSNLCRAYPVTFSIISSLDNGIELLKTLIDTQTMHLSQLERTSGFGTRLRNELTTFTYDKSDEQPLIIAILEAELGMAMTSAALRRVLLDGGTETINENSMSENWTTQAVKLAPYVSAAVISQPYAQLKNKLCLRPNNELWNHINKSPLAKSLRIKILQKEEPRLLVSRARLSHMSRCDPKVNHQTIELNEGFAPLLQHANGSISIAQILEQLKQIGATDQIIQGVKAGFLHLLDNNMLILV